MATLNAQKVVGGYRDVMSVFADPADTPMPNASSERPNFRRCPVLIDKLKKEAA